MKFSSCTTAIALLALVNAANARLRRSENSEPPLTRTRGNKIEARHSYVAPSRSLGTTPWDAYDGAACRDANGGLGTKGVDYLVYSANFKTCEEACANSLKCVGFEYQSGRCEIWLKHYGEYEEKRGAVCYWKQQQQQRQYEYDEKQPQPKQQYEYDEKQPQPKQQYEYHEKQPQPKQKYDHDKKQPQQDYKELVAFPSIFQEVLDPGNPCNVAESSKFVGGGGEVLLQLYYDKICLISSLKLIGKEMLFHIHNGRLGQNGDLLFDLTDKVEIGSKAKEVCFGLDENLLELPDAEVRKIFEDREAYTNHHTKECPQGEQRGQIVPLNDYDYTS